MGEVAYLLSTIAIAAYAIANYYLARRIAEEGKRNQRIAEELTIGLTAGTILGHWNSAGKEQTIKLFETIRADLKKRILEDS